MICPICGAQLKENETECFICGYGIDSYEGNSSDKVNSGNQTCPICNSIINERDSACPLCGTPVEVSAESLSNSVEFDDESAEELEEYDDEADREESASQTKHSKKLIRIVPVVILLLIIGIVAFFMLKDNKSDKKKAGEMTKKSTAEQTKNRTEKKADDTEVINQEDYVGYWNIKDDTTVELSINDITGDRVNFALYHKFDSIENVIALLDGNNASFSDNSGEGSIKGILTFDNSSITMNITESNQHPYIHVGTQKFDSRHKESWKDSGDTTDEYTGTSRKTNAEEPTALADVEPYTVTVTAPSVTIYSGPGQSYDIVDTLPGGETYTIVAEARDAAYTWWGKIESGTGWINLFEIGKEITGNYSNGYILPDSSSKQLTYEDIQYLSGNELLLARNEIYARHGRIFDDTDIRAYFESQPWYNGTIEPKNFSENLLSELEKNNVAFIKMYE